MKIDFKRFCIVVLILLITIIYLSIFTCATTDKSIENLDAAGYKLLYIGRHIGFWIITVVATYKVIQCALKGSRKEVGEIILTYVLIYGSMFIIPWAMKLVENIF